MNLLLQILIVLLAIPFIGFIIHKIIMFTDKLEQVTNTKEFIKTLFFHNQVIDWILLPIYLVMILAIFLLFTGIRLAEYNKKINKS